MKKILLCGIILTVLFCQSCAVTSRQLEEFSKEIVSQLDKGPFTEIEPLLKKRKYAEAEVKYRGLDSSIKKKQFAPRAFVHIQYRNFIKYLKESDRVRAFIKNANNNPVAYQDCLTNDCNHVNIYVLNKMLPKNLPFSQQFIDYVNNYHAETIALFQKTNKHLAKLERIENEQKAQAKQAKEKAEEEERQKTLAEYKKKQEKTKKARKAKRKQKEKALNAQIKALDNAAKKAGYKGFANLNIHSLINNTQQKGGLEIYLNKVVGCPELNQEPCETWYPGLKIINVLDKGLLYALVYSSAEKYFNYVIYVDREPGKIYQDEQALENAFYVFKGMFSYPTVMGTKKTVPAFSKVNIK